MKPTLLVLLMAVAVPALADGTNCRLAGKWQTPGGVHLPWDKKRELHNTVDFESCIAKAEDLLEFSFEHPGVGCGSSSRCMPTAIVTTIKSVNYEFNDGVYVLKGEIKKAAR